MFISKLSELTRWRLKNDKADALTVVRAAMDVVEDYTADGWNYTVEQREDAVSVHVVRKAHENTVRELVGALDHHVGLDVSAEGDTITIPLSELPEGVA